MTPIRIAVAGAGYIGRRHIGVLNAGDTGCVLAAVCDPSPESVARSGARDVPAYTDLAEMLERERPDGVVVATPNQLHAPVALTCIGHGAPVLIEKPLADSIPEALAVVEAGEAADVAVLTGHHRRHNPILAKAREIIDAGGVGRVVAVSGVYLQHKHKGYHDAEWRRVKGGGPLMFNAIHDIDCLRMLCGDIVSVQGDTSNAVRGFEVEDTAAAVLRFANGAVGTLLCSDTASSPWAWEYGSRENPQFPHTGQDCYQVIGTRGTLGIPSLRHYWHEPGLESWNTPLTEMRHTAVLSDAFTHQMRNFGAVIRGEAEPVVSGRDGLRSLATTLAVTRSAEAGAPVRIDDFIVSEGARG